MWFSSSGAGLDEGQIPYLSGAGPEPLQRRLDDRRDLLALLVALVRQELERERLALVVDEQPVGVLLLPARRGEERARLRHVVRVRPHLRGVRPGPGLVRPRRLAAEPQEHPVDEFALADRVGDRVPG